MVYTTLLVLIQISAQYATNLMEPSQYQQVLSDPKQVRDRIHGSKIVIGLEQCMLISTWGVKTCMLILYWRITRNLRSNLYVKILAGYVALGFVVIMITYYAVYCRPFSQYWAMPVSNMQCATYQNYSITQAVFNISSDAFMFAIPIPLLLKAKISLRRKALLLCVMSLGLFTIIAAILNKYFNFASPYTTIYQIWYIREASTAIYVANLMCWWPLLRKIFGLTAFQYSSTRGQRPQATDNPNNESNGYSRSARGSFSFYRAFHFSRPGLRRSTKNATLTGHSGTVRSSQEAINHSSNESTIDFDRVEAVPLETWQKSGEQSSKTDNPLSQETIAVFEKRNSKAGELSGEGIYCTHEFDVRVDPRNGNSPT